MNLAQALRRTIFAIVGVAWLTIFATPEYGVVWVIIGALVLALAWRSGGRWMQRAKARSVWRAIALLTLILLPIDMLLLSHSVLHPAIHITLVTQALLLFDEPSPRRWRLLLLLSLFDVLASTVLTQQLWFALLFIVYAGLAIIALTLSHLVDTASAAKGPLEEKWEGDDAGRRVARRYLLRTMATAAAAVIPIIIVLFLTLPRWDYSLIMRHTPESDAVERLNQLEQARKQTGFSDRVELGDYGRVQEDPTVVLRVKFPNGRPQQLEDATLFWRAGALNEYDGYGWATSRAEFPFFRGPRPGTPDDDGWAYARRRGHVRPVVDNVYCVDPYLQGKSIQSIRDLRVDSNLVEQEIFLELPYADNVVGLPSVVALAGLFPQGLFVDLNESYRVVHRQLLAEKISYTIFSKLPTMELDRIGDVRMEAYQPLAAHAYWGPFIQAYYLQLPRTLSPEVQNLVRDLIGEEQRVRKRIETLLAFFQDNFTYTLDTRRPSLAANPLDEFLFTTREGYCEHFATALVVMLRAAGIPARLANGFKGGVWNNLGEFYAIRQADAHTWAEVYVPDHGWIPVDPVPARSSDGFGFEPWLVPQSNLVVQYLQAFWQERILGYNLNNQTRIATDIWAWVSRQPGRIWAVLALVGQNLLAWAGATVAFLAAWASLLAPLVLALLLAALYVWRNGVSGGVVPVPGAAPVVPFYRQMLRALHRAGYPRRASDAPRAFASRIAVARPDLAPDIEALTRLYERVRFGERPLTRDELAAVRARVRRLRRQAARPEAGRVTAQD